MQAENQILMQFSIILHWKMLRLLILLGIGILGCQADCNVCSVTGVACVSHTEFEFCANNLPIEPLNKCPPGTFCTPDARICLPDAELASCKDCGKCNEEMEFACTGVHTFALCLGTVVPSNVITGTCAQELTCNLNNPHICGTAAEGFQPTCPLADDQDSAIDGGLTGDEYCGIVQKAGRFPYGTDPATTCKQYVLCFYRGGLWSGNIYNCPGTTYFEPSISNCNVSLPSTCTERVKSIQVLNIRLF